MGSSVEQQGRPTRQGDVFLHHHVDWCNANARHEHNPGNQRHSKHLVINTPLVRQPRETGCMALAMSSACTCPATRQQLVNDTFKQTSFCCGRQHQTSWCATLQGSQHTPATRVQPILAWDACHCPPATESLRNIHSPLPSSFHHKHTFQRNLWKLHLSAMLLQSDATQIGCLAATTCEVQVQQATAAQQLWDSSTCHATHHARHTLTNTCLTFSRKQTAADVQTLPTSQRSLH